MQILPFLLSINVLIVNLLTCIHICFICFLYTIIQIISSVINSKSSLVTVLSATYSLKRLKYNFNLVGTKRPGDFPVLPRILKHFTLSPRWAYQLHPVDWLVWEESKFGATAGEVAAYFKTFLGLVVFKTLLYKYHHFCKNINHIKRFINTFPEVLTTPKKLQTTKQTVKLNYFVIFKITTWNSWF